MTNSLGNKYTLSLPKVLFSAPLRSDGNSEILSTQFSYKGFNLTQNVITLTMTYNLVPKDSGLYISTIRATGGYIINLPKAVKGMFFEFSIDSLNNLRVQPNVEDHFISGIAGKYKQINTVSSRLKMIVVAENIWSVSQIGN